MSKIFQYLIIVSLLVSQKNLIEDEAKKFLDDHDSYNKMMVAALELIYDLSELNKAYYNLIKKYEDEINKEISPDSMKKKLMANYPVLNQEKQLQLLQFSSKFKNHKEFDDWYENMESKNKPKIDFDPYSKFDKSKFNQVDGSFKIKKLEDEEAYDLINEAQLKDKNSKEYAINKFFQLRKATQPDYNAINKILSNRNEKKVSKKENRKYSDLLSRGKTDDEIRKEIDEEEWLWKWVAEFIGMEKAYEAQREAELKLRKYQQSTNNNPRD